MTTIVPMKMDRKYIRRRRVAFVIALALAVAVGWGFWQVISNLWWVGNGYCWGSMTECFFGEGKQ